MVLRKQGQMKKIIFIIVVFGCLLSGCALIFQSQIKNQDIENHLTGKRFDAAVGNDSFKDWSFGFQGGRCVNIVKSQYDNDKAVIFADVVTNQQDKKVYPPVEEFLAGRVELNYAYSNGVWVLKSMKNLTFSRQFETGMNTFPSAEGADRFFELQSNICKDGYDNGKWKDMKKDGREKQP